MSGSVVPYRARDEAEPAGAPETDDDDVYSGDLDAMHGRLVRWFEEAERSSS